MVLREASFTVPLFTPKEQEKISALFFCENISYSRIWYDNISKGEKKMELLDYVNSHHQHMEEQKKQINIPQARMPKNEFLEMMHEALNHHWDSDGREE